MSLISQCVGLSFHIWYMLLPFHKMEKTPAFASSNAHINLCIEVSFHVITYKKLMQLVHDLKRKQDEPDNITNKHFKCMPKDSFNINVQQVPNRETSSDVEQISILRTTEEKLKTLSMTKDTSMDRCEELHQVKACIKLPIGFITSLKVYMPHFFNEINITC